MILANTCRRGRQDPRRCTSRPRFQEVAGRLAQDYRKRIDLLETETATTPEALADEPDTAHQRHLRYVMELEGACTASAPSVMLSTENGRRTTSPRKRTSLRKRLVVARHSVGLSVPAIEVALIQPATRSTEIQEGNSPMRFLGREAVSAGVLRGGTPVNGQTGDARGNT